MNWWIIPVAALIPMIVGALWYSKWLFEKPWMEDSGMTEEKMRSGNMPLIFGLSYVFNCLIGAALTTIVCTPDGFRTTSSSFSRRFKPI